MTERGAVNTSQRHTNTHTKRANKSADRDGNQKKRNRNPAEAGREKYWRHAPNAVIEKGLVREDI